MKFVIIHSGDYYFKYIINSEEDNTEDLECLNKVDEEFIKKYNVSNPHIGQNGNNKYQLVCDNHFLVPKYSSNQISNNFYVYADNWGEFITKCRLNLNALQWFKYTFRFSYSMCGNSGINMLYNLFETIDISLKIK